MNLNFVRVTLANFRRYHFLDQYLKALTWHHLCVTYGQGVTVSYLDGVEQQSHQGHPGEPIRGTHVKVGAWDADSSYSGQLSQVSSGVMQGEGVFSFTLAHKTDGLQ